MSNSQGKHMRASAVSWSRSSGALCAICKTLREKEEASQCCDCFYHHDCLREWVNKHQQSRLAGPRVRGLFAALLICLLLPFILAVIYAAKTSPTVASPRKDYPSPSSSAPPKYPWHCQAHCCSSSFWSTSSSLFSPNTQSCKPVTTPSSSNY